VGGKSKKTTVGYWYLPAYHAGLGIGPIDAFLEFRGGDKPAWIGELTASGTISINAPMLWGGEKDQGGIVGDVDVMFGEEDQQPNQYLINTFGPQQPAWRGMATLVFKGGKYGAMNPYPQKASYKIRKIINGWSDACWYPEKAAIPFDSISVPYDGMWAYKVEEPGSTADYSAPSYDHSGWTVAQGAFGSNLPPGSGIALNTAVGGLVGRSIWIRRRVGFVGLTTIDVYHDDGAWLWVDGVPVVLTTVNYYHATAQVMLTGNSVVALKVTDGVPSGSANIFAGLVFMGGTVDKLAMNPAHILYYSRANSDMGRESPANINEASFTAAADWFHSNGFGLCTSYDPSAESVEEFEQRICRVAGCSLTRSLIDGQWYLDIANGEYDLESLPILTDDDILEFEEQPTLLDSAVNSVSVKYFDPELKETIVTPPVQAPALIADFGTNHLTIEYLEIPTGALALRVAQRELLARVTPLRGFPLKTTRKPYAWRPSTYFRLQSPKRRIADMVCIFSEKSSGQLRSGAMTISATQDVYSVPAASFVEIEPGVDTRPPQTPEPIMLQRAFEAPYIDVVTALSRADLEALPDDVGFLEAVAVDPATSRDFSMLVQPDGGDYAEVAGGEWCPSTTVVEAAGHLDTMFTLDAAYRLGDVAVGMPALWDDEIVRIDALNIEAGTILLARGCADTVPEPHAAGSRLWFWIEAGAADTTEYTAGETVNVKLLTNTWSQQLPLASATTLPITLGQRQARPYPPGWVTVNGAVTPPATVIGDVELAWTHRDRVQQADQLVDTLTASIGPEAGTTYTVRWILNGTLVHTDSGLTAPEATWAPTGGGLLRVEVESVRDGLASWQMHVREIAIGSPLLAESGEMFTTEDDAPILME